METKEDAKPPAFNKDALSCRPAVVRVDDLTTVSGLLTSSSNPLAGCVLAHGAGAGMNHSFLEAIADGLGERGIATLRFQFPYMEKKLRRPDPPHTARLTVRAAVQEAARLLPGIPLFAGGKSFGGRMTSQAQAESPLPKVRGLVFLGFPLHPAGKPSTTRAEHLAQVRVPMLFFQGSRDTLAQLDLIQPLLKGFGPRATLKVFPEADHSFHVPARSGMRDVQVRTELLDTFVEWISNVLRTSRPSDSLEKERSL